MNRRAVAPSVIGAILSLELQCLSYNYRPLIWATTFVDFFIPKNRPIPRQIWFQSIIHVFWVYRIFGWNRYWVSIFFVYTTKNGHFLKSDHLRLLFSWVANFVSFPKCTTPWRHLATPERWIFWETTHSESSSTTDRRKFAD